MGLRLKFLFFELGVNSFLIKFKWKKISILEFKNHFWYGILKSISIPLKVYSHSIN